MGKPVDGEKEMMRLAGELMFRRPEMRAGHPEPREQWQIVGMNLSTGICSQGVAS